MKMTADAAVQVPVREAVCLSDGIYFHHTRLISGDMNAALKKQQVQPATIIFISERQRRYKSYHTNNALIT
jgi:enterochelin esterase-like enzyme